MDILETRARSADKKLSNYQLSAKGARPEVQEDRYLLTTKGANNVLDKYGPKVQQSLVEENTFPNDEAANSILKQRGYKKGDRVQINSGGENILWEIE
jgi:hypothetical protein